MQEYKYSTNVLSDSSLKKNQKNQKNYFLLESSRLKMERFWIGIEQHIIVFISSASIEKETLSK